MDDVPIEKSGDIIVSVYRTSSNTSPFFSIKPNNENVSDIAYIIEDVLKMY